jgi:ankyrin repeat protein
MKSSNFSVIPQSISEIFLLQMNMLFPSQLSFSKAKEIFAVCLASLKKLKLETVYGCVQAAKTSTSDQATFESPSSSSAEEWNEFLKAYSQIKDFLPQNETTGTIGFFHATFRDWLLVRRTYDPNKFVCDPQFGHHAIAMWFTQKSLDKKLDETETVELVHHLLKSQVFKPDSDKLKDLISESSCDVSKALASMRNLSNPNIVVSKLLLMASASPDVKIDDESTGLSTPLISQFISRGNGPMTSLLIEFGADLDARDSRGITPLMVAAGSDRNRAIVRQILTQRPCAINQSCNDGSTPLAFAAKMGAGEVLKILLECPWPPGGCSKEVAVQEALLSAIKFSRDDTAVKIILETAEPNIDAECKISHELPMEAAIRRGRKSICELLLEHGVVLRRLRRPLHLAVESGHWSIVELLIKNGCDVSATDEKGRTPLVLAAMRGEVSEFAFQILNGLKDCRAGEKDGRAFLRDCTFQVAIADLLLSKGARVDNDRDEVEHATPLSWACLEGKERMVDCLIGHSADVNAKDNRLRSPLHQAATSGCETIVNKLLEAGAQIEAVDRNGIRPIDQAICFGHRVCVGAFLRKGAKLGPTTWTMARGKPLIMYGHSRSRLKVFRVHSSSFFQVDVA